MEPRAFVGIDPHRVQSRPFVLHIAHFDTQLVEQLLAFLAAMRDRDFEGLVAVLDPGVVVRTETAEGVREIRGARNWARGAVAFAQHARSMQPVLVGGTVGIILAPGGRLLRAVRFTFANGKIIEADVIIPPERLRKLDLAVLSG